MKKVRPYTLQPEEGISKRLAQLQAKERTFVSAFTLTYSVLNFRDFSFRVCYWEHQYFLTAVKIILLLKLSVDKL